MSKTTLYNDDGTDASAMGHTSTTPRLPHQTFCPDISTPLPWLRSSVVMGMYATVVTSSVMSGLSATSSTSYSTSSSSETLITGALCRERRLLLQALLQDTSRQGRVELSFYKVTVL